MKNYISIILLLLVFRAEAQMFYNGKFQFGNEWIVSSQSYYKFTIKEDGMYRITFDDLVSAGIPVQSITGAQLQLFTKGEEVYLHLSTEGSLQSGDFIQFYATKNKADLDATLLRANIPLFNTEYSMFSDESSYYLTWSANNSNKRFIEKVNDNSRPLPLENSYIKKEIITFSEIPTKRAHGLKKSLKMPDFDEGQGYGTSYERERSVNLSFKNKYDSGNEANINVRLFGEGSSDATVHKMNIYIDEVLKNTFQFTGFKVKDGMVNIPSNELKDILTLKVIANGNPEDKFSISTIQYQYDSEFKFNQSSYEIIHIAPSLTRKSIVLEDFNGGNELYLYDITNNYYLKSIKQPDGKYPIDLPPSDDERKIVIINSSAFKSIKGLTNTVMEDYQKGDYNYLMLTSKRLRTSSNDPISDYVQYRFSPEGGSYKVKVVYIEDIEEVFGFGIRTHSIAIRNFFQYSRTIWPNMKYALIIGKGLEYQVYRTDSRYDSINYVPTFSEPAADLLLVSDTLRVPFYTLGRIPVQKTSEITDYLNKVKEHEAYLRSTNNDISNREWLKKIVHLAGGDQTIYANLRSQLVSMENEIESNPFGGQVYTFYKESNLPVEVINSELLSNLVNTGVSIISFMGHSISYKLDFNLDNINDYKNKGKYHVFIALGCYAGEMFLESTSISETQNLTADKGSILYISNTSAGLPGILSSFGQDFYAQIGGNYYGKSIGDAVRDVFNDLILTNDQFKIYQALSTSFNGDPVIRINSNPEVDLTLDGTTAKTKSNFIFADQKYFDFNVDLVNLGKFINDSVRIKIENVFPDNTIKLVYNGKVSVPSIRQKQSFTIPIDENLSIGQNTLLITIDPDNVLAEGPSPDAENNNTLITGNNTLGYSYYVIGNNAKPVYPAEFAIINEDKPTLVAYNGNIFSQKSNYYLELDTTEYYNSPLKKINTINQTGGVISWKLNESLLPNTVYYWRVRPDSMSNSILAWQSSSFIYIPGTEIGWNQSHFFQHQENELKGIQNVEPKRTFELKNAFVDFLVINAYVDMNSTNYQRPKIYIGDAVRADYTYWSYRTDLSGILIGLIDNNTGNMITNISGSDGGSIGGASMAGSNYFLFATDTKEERAKIIDFIKNTVPDQYYVVIQTLVQDNYTLHSDQWLSDGANNLIDFFKSLGAKSVDQFLASGDVPYSIIYAKNRMDYETRDRVGDRNGEANINYPILVKFKEGSMRSVLVGPAIAYSKFLWDYSLFDNINDKLEVNIYGVDKSGNEVLLFGPVSQSEVDLTSIDATIYPQLRLEWKTGDTKNYTIPNLNYWRVYYKGLPDVTYNPAYYFKKSADTLNQGSLFLFEITASNISKYNMDSLLVKFTLTDQFNMTIESEKRFIPLQSFENLKIPYQVKSSKQFGSYKLIIELNPNQDQPEFNVANNTAVINFYVRKDKRNPNATIFFDGVVINNGDIVSPTTQIIVKLRDEDNSLPLIDPSLFNLKIITPNKNEINIDPSTQSNVTFVPANTSSNINEASMIINGNFDMDGIHTLVVRAKDANGNQISETDEKVDYRIIHENSISNVFNYPNPFSTKTRFIYTLTGKDLPTFYKIQILTVSGKVVKEIDQSELGPLSIGTNMTQYEYDGTDQFGQKLANGVYLYKAIFKEKDGSDLKKFDTDTDKFFKSNIGKMVILR